MIYELRVYDVVPGKLGVLNDRFAMEVYKGFLEKYGGKVVGFWTDEVGTNNRLTSMLAFDDMDQRATAWSAIRADEEVLKIIEESLRDGEVVVHVRNTIMRPTSYSPLQ